MYFEEIIIPGCYIITPIIQQDGRGAFIKTWNNTEFLKKNLNLVFLEEYYSISKKSVSRGMHFQEPPKALYKFVYCLSGKVQDVLLVIRKNSPSFGKHFSIELDDSINSAKSPLIIIAPGVAHGFMQKKMDRF